ncbi:MAG: type I methionyl aminopeptidase [Bacilli bacterium]
MIVQNEQDLDALKEIGRIVALAREAMIEAAKEGMTTKELDAIGEAVLKEHGALSAPINEYNFPGYTCISVNEAVAHGIPNNYTLKSGDLVNVDVSACKNGYYADTGASFVIGTPSETQQKLLDVGQECLYEAMKKLKAGAKSSHFGKTVQQIANNNGFTVIKNLTGHGIGRKLHEEPQHILNYLSHWDSFLCKEGMVLAIEPFVSTQDENIVESGDGWTLVTPNKSQVVQFEHTIIVTKDEPIILTKLD